MKHLGRRMEANARAYLDGGVDGVADDAGVGLPGAEPDRGDLGAGVEDEVAGHTLAIRLPLRSHRTSGTYREC